MAGRFSGSEPKLISQTGSTFSRSLPMTPDVQLASLDVLLDQRVGVRLFVDERDALLELPLVR